MVEESPVRFPSALQLAVLVVLNYALKQRARMFISQSAAPGDITGRGGRERQDCSNRNCVG